MVAEVEEWRGRMLSSLWFRRNASFRARKIRRRFLNRNAGVETLSTSTELKTRGQAQATSSVEVFSLSLSLSLSFSYLFSKRITLRPNRTRSPNAKNPYVTFSHCSILDERDREISIDHPIHTRSVCGIDCRLSNFERNIQTISRIFAVSFRWWWNPSSVILRFAIKFHAIQFFQYRIKHKIPMFCFR